MVAVWPATIETNRLGWGRRPRYRQCFFPPFWVPKWAPTAQQSNQELFPCCQKTVTLFSLFQLFLPRQNHRWTKAVVCIVPTSFSYTYHMYTSHNTEIHREADQFVLNYSTVLPWHPVIPTAPLPWTSHITTFSVSFYWIMRSLMAQTLSCSLSYPKHLTWPGQQMLNESQNL